MENTSTPWGNIIRESQSLKYYLTDQGIIIMPDGDDWFMVEDDCPDCLDSFEGRCDMIEEELRIMMREFA